ncbi:APC family permease [Peribacillus sp. NPDC006672]|uniref:APC family permease n=1 Tax=Peribacillus sp. NPDC006672 TaxID=3390606 RepID=UPI003D052C13
MSNQSELELNPQKKLGFWAVWALGVGSVIGDGIFLLMGQGIAIAGPGSIVAYGIAGFSQLFLLIALGELAVGMPSAGAMSHWVDRFMGKWWGFLAGFTFAIGWVIAGGSVGIGIGKITMWFFPQLQGDFWPLFFSILFISIFAILNILGTEIAAKTQLLLVAIMTIIMALFSIIGLKDININHFTPFLPHGAEGFWSAIPLGAYAYLGAVTLTTAGGEVKNPKDLPKAMIWASITFLILYSAAQFVLQGLIPWNEITIDSSPFTVAAEMVFGIAGAYIMNMTAWIAAATCLLMGTFYASSRIFYAQAKSGYLPAFFGRIHPKTGTPVYGITVVWLLSIALVFLGSSNPNFLYIELSNQMVFAWLISWSLALVAGVLYRRNNLQEVKRLAWNQPLYPLFPILGFIGIMIVFFGSFVGSPITLVRGVIWMGILYILFKIFNKTKKSSNTVGKGKSM